ncbi:MAG: hypothetical protein AAGB12_07820 [Pseudomonadota bacterium]
MGPFFASILQFPLIIILFIFLGLMVYWLLIACNYLSLKVSYPDSARTSSIELLFNKLFSAWKVDHIPDSIFVTVWCIQMGALSWILVNFNAFSIEQSTFENWAMKTLYFSLSIICTLPLASKSTQKLAAFVIPYLMVSKKSLIMQKCLASTNEVTPIFGKILFKNNGVCAELEGRSVSDYPIEAGDELMIIDYDCQHDYFKVVKPEEVSTSHT